MRAEVVLVMETLELDVETGPGRTVAGLTLFPLFGSEPAGTGYATAKAAFESGAVDVSEVDGAGDVPTLEVVNHGTKPVLFVEGETIVGLNQNRVLNVSVLVPAAATHVIPVSCVEALRWGSATAPRRSEYHAPAGLRARKAASVQRQMRTTGQRHSNQREVWEDVDRYVAAARAPAPTAALEDAFAERGAGVAEVAGRLRPAPGQVGVLAMWGEGNAALDLFDSHDTLCDYWDSLVGGYWMDAVAEAPGPHGASEAERVLVAIAEAVVSRVAATGEGIEIHSGDAPGSSGPGGLTIAGLEWNGRLVHLAAFAGATNAAGV